MHPHGEIQINPVAFSPVRYENLAIDISTGVDTESTRGIIISAIKNDFTAKESELDRVKFLSYDITLTGEHNNILMLEKLARNLEENFHQDLNDTKISARRVWIHVNPKVDDMELLAREPSPAGVLARAILALNKNEPNDFVNELIGNWNTEKQRLQRSAMFDMLDETNEHNNSERVNPQKYLLTECNRILTELIQQQHDA